MMTKRRIYILGIVLLILLLAVGSCRKAGSWLVKQDDPEQADVMVMLMGSIADRVLQVADLYHAQLAGKVWIVDEAMGPDGILEERGVHLVTNTAQVRSALISLGIPADSILILPGDATSSTMEAEIVRDHLHRQFGIDTLLLVSSAAHMRRASMTFESALKALENPPVVCCSPSSYTSFHAKRWWRNKNDIQKVVTEYMKMVNLVLFERRDLRKKEL